MPQSSFTINYAAILLELTKEHGGSAAELLEGSMLDESALLDIESRLSTEQLRTLVNNGLRSTAEPALGLYFGQRLTLMSHGVLGYALMSCKSLQQVVEILMKYYRLLLDTATLQLIHEDDFVTIVYKEHDIHIDSHRTTLEIFFSGLLSSLKQLLHRDNVGVKLRFSFPRPVHANAYYAIFGPDVQFDCAVNQISIPVDILAEKPEFASPTMLKIYQQQCDALVAQMGANEGLRSQVKKYLLAKGRPFPLLEQTASHFNMSSRTFRRRLSEENTSFQKILDSLRRELAETYLRNHALSVENVAELLGFNDTSNFRRAFIRWTGISPSVFQKKNYQTKN